VNPRRACVAHTATRSPRAPPSAATRTLSVRNCRTTRPPLAPSARRTAISRRRVAARASIRFATFVPAMASTSPTTTTRSAENPRIAPFACGGTRASLSRRSDRRRVAPERSVHCSLYEARSREARTSRRGWTSATETPRGRRPTSERKRLPRLRSASLPGTSRDRWARGSHASTATPRERPVKGSATTPTTESAVPESVSVRPSTDGSPARRRCQRPWLITTAGAADARSSSGPRGRPRRVRTFKAGK
jgi:hypothetical protein